jgi:hypothetical protein
MFCCCGLFLRCTTENFRHSPLFLELFSEEKSTFRGTDLGDPMTLVKQNEAAVAGRHNDSGTPKHDDRLGLAFEYTLTDSLLLFVEYYPKNPSEQSDSNRVASIVANISLNDEVEIAQIYNEIEQYFTRKYRISSGTYGNYSWKSSTPKTQSMEVGLKMSDNKKGITIMFIDTQTN